jgi:hypothetical protein
MPFTVDSIRRSMARETLSARRAGLPFPHDRIDRLKRLLDPPPVTLATAPALPAVPPMDDTQHALLAAYLHALIRAKEAQDPEEYEAAAREADRLWAMLRGDHAEQTATMASDPFAAPKWSEYHGPRGGRGWHNPETGQRRYNARDPNLPRASGRLDPDHPDAPYQKWMVPGEELTDDLRAEIDHHRANIGEVPPADAKVEQYDPKVHGTGRPRAEPPPLPGQRPQPRPEPQPKAPPKTGDPFAEHESGPQARPGAAPQPQPKPQPAPKSNDPRANPDLDAAFGMEPRPQAPQPAPRPAPVTTPSGGPPPARVDVPSGGGQPVPATPAGQQRPAPVPQAPAPQPARTPAKIAPPEPPAVPQPRVSPEQYRAAAAESYQSRRQEEDRARVEWVRQHRPDLLHKLPGAPQPAPYISRTPARIHHDEEPVELEPAESVGKVSDRTNPTTPQPHSPTPVAKVDIPESVRKVSGPTFDPHAELADLGAKLERHAAGHLAPGLTDQLTRVATRMGVSEENLLHQAAEAHAATQGPPTTHPRDVTGQPTAPAARDFGHAHRLLRQKAQAAGLDPDEVQSVADHILRDHNAQADQHNELLKFVRKHGGVDVIRRGKDKRVAGREDNVRGLDTVAQEAAGLFPAHFREPTAANGGEHHEQLQAMLEQGDKPRLTPEQAYQKAMEQAEEEAYHKRLKAETEGDGPQRHAGDDYVPFSTDARLFAVLSALPDEVTTFTFAGERWERIPPVEWSAMLSNDGWEPYRGPRGGIGWKNVATGRIVYTASQTAPGYARRQVQSSAKRALELSGRHAAHLRGTGEAHLSEAELRELADHVQALPVHTLRSLKNHVMGTWGNVRRRQDMVEALTGHVRGLVDKHQAMEQDYHQRNDGDSPDDEARFKKERIAGHMEDLTPSLRADRLAGWKQERQAAGGQAPVPAPPVAPPAPVPAAAAAPVPVPVPAPAPPPAPPTPEATPTGVAEPWPSEPADPPAGASRDAAGDAHDRVADELNAPSGIVSVADLRKHYPHLGDKELAEGIENLADAGTLRPYADMDEGQIQAAGGVQIGERWFNSVGRPAGGKISADDLRAAFGGQEAAAAGSHPMPFPVKEPAPFESKSTVGQTGPVEDVPVKSLVATQKDLDPAYMKELHGGAEPKTKGPPKVVRINDEHHIDDGHHRAAKEAHGGAETIKAEVFEHDPATKKTRPLKYTPVPEDVSDEEYDRQFEEAKQKAAAGLAKMAEKQKERAARKAALKESAPVAQEAPSPPPAQAPAAEPAPPVAEAPAVKAEPPKADHLALARQYLRGGVIDAAEADKLRTTYASLPDTDRTRFAEAMGVESAARSLPEVRDELVERKVREMAHRGEHGPEVKRNTGNPLFGKPGVGESQGLFDAAPEEAAQKPETPKSAGRPPMAPVVNEDSYESEFGELNGHPFTFGAQREESGNWHVSFASPTGGSAVSGKAGSRAVGIMRGAADELDKFVGTVRPDRFTYSADVDEPSRVRLYDHAAQKVADRLGYTMERREEDGNVDYHFTREAARANPPEAPPDPAPKPQAPARQADPPPPEPKAEAKPAVDPEALGKRLAAAHSDRMSDNPTTGRKGDQEFDRLLEEIGKLPPDQRAKAMAAAEPPKPAPKPKGTRVTRTNEHHHGNGSVTRTHFLSDDRHSVTEAGDRFHLHEQAGGRLGHKGEYGSLEEAMAGASTKATGIADRLKAHVAGLKGDAAEHTSGDPLLKELEGMSQAEVFKALEAAGIEAIRPGDSKSELIRRARLRLTASARAQERNAV